MVEKLIINCFLKFWNKDTFVPIIKTVNMIWKKLKKVIIPLIIAKVIILVFFIFRGNTISISRDINCSTYQEGFDNDSIALKKQKLIRIVRNEEERGISIKLRGRKNAKHLREKEEIIPIPIVD